MGTVYQYCCEGCEYVAEVSGGPDCGMQVFTETFCCAGCQSLVDVVVARAEPGGSWESPKPTKEKRCPSCRSRRLTPWAAQQACPRCGGSMKQDADFVMCWD